MEVTRLLNIDQAITNVDRIICKNIAKFEVSERGLLSADILAHLRNFVEYIAEKIYANGSDIDPNDYEQKKKAIKSLKCNRDTKFITVFHEMLQKSASHYTLDEGGSERLMLKYYTHLLLIKNFLHDTYGLEVLQNLSDFPLDTDTELSDYYKQIVERIENRSPHSSGVNFTERYYIQKVKPFFVNQHIYYEVTFSTASERSSKFERVIAFTKHNIMDNYSVRMSIHSDIVSVLGMTMNILVIDSWSVSIRPCELTRLSQVLGEGRKVDSSSVEYQMLMRFMTEYGMTLLDIVEDENVYTFAYSVVFQRAKVPYIFDVLKNCATLVRQQAKGANTLRYLLYTLNNKIIKEQSDAQSCTLLSNLYLRYGCIPFDKMPFCFSLCHHNPAVSTLFECIPMDGHVDELLARFVRNQAEINRQLFTPLDEITQFDNIPNLVAYYNSRLYYKHKNQELQIFHGHLCLTEYVNDCKAIIEALTELSKEGIGNYTNSVESWLEKSAYQIDSEEKRTALCEMFSASRVAFIYGAAGTGKSTMLNHISNFFAQKRKLYVAHTNPAVDNMRRRVIVDKSEFKTISKIVCDSRNREDCDILFIDECSTVSNADMRKLLEQVSFKLLVLVGDVYQIESIRFGNWFEIAKAFIPGSAISELVTPFRSTDANLLQVWNRVRTLDNSILEALVKFGFSSRIDTSILEHTTDDQIVLCLNYDGLYGINNINRLLQFNNPSPAIRWGIGIYKAGDPILFNESNRFSPLIYNNMKGKIVSIVLDDDKIWFEVELEISINEFDAAGYDFEIVCESEPGHTIIRFYVDKYKSTDEDNDSIEATVPFQVAYAVSIHKAQGLEYDSVKIVVTKDVEERINHNIFYTAITRAKKDLKIYWSPETENYILNNFKIPNYGRDVSLLRAKLST